jgi:ankyrin repeat protein
MSDLERLSKAAKLRDVDQVRTILDEDGELVHKRDEAGATVLHYATLDGLREMVQLLSDTSPRQRYERKVVSTTGGRVGQPRSYGPLSIAW